MDGELRICLYATGNQNLTTSLASRISDISIYLEAASYLKRNKSSRKKNGLKEAENLSDDNKDERYRVN